MFRIYYENVFSLKKMSIYYRNLPIVKIIKKPEKFNLVPGRMFLAHDVAQNFPQITNVNTDKKLSDSYTQEAHTK